MPCVQVRGWIPPLKYSFDSDIIGSNPAGVSLTIIEPAGSGYVEVANQSGRMCARIVKEGGGDRVRIVDDIAAAKASVGAIHCYIYHDAAAYGLNIEAADGSILSTWYGGTGKSRTGRAGRAWQVTR